MKIKGHTVSKGRATGPALVSAAAISFLGGVDPQTGTVVEQGHPLFGRSVKGTVLVFPGGKGSTVGSYLIYQLKKNGVAPVAMINVRAEPIVAVGAIISEIPMVDRLEQDPAAVIRDGLVVTVDGTAGEIEVPAQEP
jgi:uncharacterized protein